MKFTTPFLALASFVSVVLASPAQVHYACTVPNTAAISFDDGPYIWSRDISKMLTDAGAKGTFFVNGDNYGCIYSEENQDNLRFLLSEGHQLASHTWEHSDLNTLSWDQLHDTFWKVEEALSRIAGVYPAFMRPPFGNFNDLVKEVAGVRGQTIAIWDVDSGDSLGKSATYSKKVYTDAAAKHPSTINALNHETIESTVFEVLPHAIKKLKDAGYNLVTVAECLGMEPYQSRWEPEAPNPNWTC